MEAEQLSHAYGQTFVVRAHTMRSEGEDGDAQLTRCDVSGRGVQVHLRPAARPEPDGQRQGNGKSYQAQQASPPEPRPCTGTTRAPREGHPRVPPWRRRLRFLSRFRRDLRLDRRLLGRQLAADPRHQLTCVVERFDVELSRQQLTIGVELAQGRHAVAAQVQALDQHVLRLVVQRVGIDEPPTKGHGTVAVAPFLGLRRQL